MATCFVIQPFDKGPFDKRFEDVLRPAIVAAGLEPYRVDQDPGASILIEQIEAGIRSAELCIADISLDNPNVWFELGFAIASRKEVLLICSSERLHFPFDVQHRSVISYKTDSMRDFDDLRDQIAKRIKAIRTKGARLGTAASVASPIAPTEGLEQHELVALVAVGQNAESQSDAVSTYDIRNDMERAGFTRIAVTIGLISLLKKGFLSVSDVYDDQNDTSRTFYSLTDEGLAWLLANQAKLALRKPEKPEKPEKDVPF